MLGSAFDQAGYKTVANYVPVWQNFRSRYPTWSRSKLGAGAELLPWNFFSVVYYLHTSKVSFCK
jgi:hypothetical protein